LLTCGPDLIRYLAGGKDGRRHQEDRHSVAVGCFR
jgi:hypothetical protein